ncbi:glycosyl hydrolase family 18 protein [Paenibacillus sp. N1-5-1-14]|uniref:glycosyl hydrolase family 18 protein n=1 Tax=Paenibacillus radicibacter TaxID=2972488 RepID=UPI00215900F4|nr:glycosyl hydrolase family 18 protein [Paenibacillus radicibacter]MCR8641639.1 glycosyl hydrolase family 18 protein [Paenibacillus radicibacter]
MLKKASLAIFATMTLLGSSEALAYQAQMNTFMDVGTDWATASIYKLSALGVISGTGNGTFQGSGVVTREAFVKMLMASSSTLSSQTTKSMSIQDVSDPAHWSYSYIQQAFSAGLLDDIIVDNRFKPSQEITREEVAVLTGKFLLQSLTAADRDKWLQTSWQTEKTSRAFVDGTKIKDANQPELYYSSSLGIIVGDEQKQFRPQDSLTRKEAAAIIERVMNTAAEKHQLQGVGFYAIQSYSNVDKMSLLQDVKFGWSQLAYSGSGSASLDMKTAPFAVPDGWQAAMDKAKSYNINRKELMIYADNKDNRLSSFLTDQAAQKAFIGSVHDLLTSNNPYGFNGISIDFEGLLKVEEQGAYTSFLRDVKSAIKGYTLSVAVPPTDWYKGYDMKQIGQIADQVILMAYDYTHKDSKLPSAPLPLVNDAIQTALSVIPKEKLVLGISKQANQWITSPDGKISLENPAINLVEERAVKAGSKLEFMLPYFLEQITFQDDRGSHVIWYEDKKSIAEKMWLAKYYQLQGVSLWHMGNYNAADWDIVKQYMAP